MPFKVSMAHIFTKELLLKMYEVDQMSTTEIAEKMNVAHSTVRKYMREHGIERRSKSESRLMMLEKQRAPVAKRRGLGRLHDIMRRTHERWKERAGAPR